MAEPARPIRRRALLHRAVRLCASWRRGLRFYQARIGWSRTAPCLQQTSRPPDARARRWVVRAAWEALRACGRRTRQVRPWRRCWREGKDGAVQQVVSIRVLIYASKVWRLVCAEVVRAVRAGEHRGGACAQSQQSISAAERQARAGATAPERPPRVRYSCAMRDARAGMECADKANAESDDTASWPVCVESSTQLRPHPVCAASSRAPSASFHASKVQRGSRQGSDCAAHSTVSARSG